MIDFRPFAPAPPRPGDPPAPEADPEHVERLADFDERLANELAPVSAPPTRPVAPTLPKPGRGKSRSR
jgi:hypothetical protein